jgi:ParB-like nuclease domain/DNA methylase
VKMFIKGDVAVTTRQPWGKEMSLFQIEQVPASSLNARQRNPRVHSKKQIQQIAASIKEFGFNNPILVDKEGEILAGHGRVEAAKLLGLTTLPIVRIEHLTEEQKRAFVIADNKIALNAGWDLEMLALDFKELSSLNLAFDLETTGFDTSEISYLIDGAIKRAPIPDAAEIIPPREQTAVTERGDLRILGEHKLLCADPRDGEAHMALLGQEKATMAFIGLYDSEQAAALTEIFAQAARSSTDGAIHFVCFDSRHIGDVVAAGKEAYSEFKDLCIWSHERRQAGSLYHSEHQPILVCRVGKAAPIKLNRRRSRSNVWNYGGVEIPSDGGKPAEIAKPVSLVIGAIKDCSRAGDLVLDPFCRVGTTIIAAEKVARTARVIESDPRWADVAIRRWQTFTGGAAVLKATGDRFEDVAATRARGAKSSRQHVPAPLDV